MKIKLIWDSFASYRSIQKLVEVYDLFTLLGDTEMYDWFKKCLAGNTFNTWEAIAVDEDEATCDEILAQLVENLIDEDAYTFQKDYLSETKNPGNMPTKIGSIAWRQSTLTSLFLILEIIMIRLTKKDLWELPPTIFQAHGK